MNNINPTDQSVQDHLQIIFSFLGEYKWLIDSYLSDYFVKNLSDQLPSSWEQTLGELEPQELASFLRSDTWISKKVWPLSLMAFRCFATRMCLDRTWRTLTQTELAGVLSCKNKGQDRCTARPEPGTDALVTPDNPEVPAGGSPCFVDGQYRRLDHCYRRHVKPKKQHEILSLGKTIDALCGLCACDHVVDVGSGQGHLSRILSFGYGVKVTTIEAVGCHLPKAEKFDREVTKDIKKRQFHTRQGKKKKKKLQPAEASDQQQQVNATKVLRPRHIVSTIDPHIPVQEFLERLQLESSSRAGKTNTRGGPLNQVPNDSGLCLIQYKNTSESAERLMNIHDGEIRSRDTRNGGCNSDNGFKDTDDIQNNSEETGHDCNCQDGCRCSQFGTSYGDHGDDCPEFVLTGLHACGDLTPTLTRVFVQSPTAVALASVGCCYMKMSTSSQGEEAGNRGYPMSDFVARVPDHELSYEAMEMACHFIDNYWKRLLEGSPNLRTHCYRSALQEIIKQKDPTIEHGCIKLTIKNMEKISFHEYATKALGRLGLDPALTDDQLSVANTRTARWKDVVAFYTLRLSLAPLIETVVLLDRLLYLKEQGIQCCLLPVFDPKISPRNFVLMGRKDKKDQHS